MNFKVAIAFVAGVAVGALSTWKIVEKKYQEIADEEIKSVIDRFSPRKSEPTENVKEETDEAPWRATKPDIMEYEAKIRAARYALEEHDEKEEKGGDESMEMPKIYVISPEEFDEMDDYDIKSFTYYEDGTLVDDNGFIIENPDEVVGVGSLNTFGEYEEDSVFVRNESLMTDIEILRDVRNYADVHTMPRVDNE